MDNAVVQAVGLALGLALTLMIYSYLLGDNPLYRIAVHVLVGVGTAYAAVVITHAVVIPQLINPLQQALSGTAVSLEARLQPLVALLAVLLLLKLSPRTAALGNITMGFVMGIGAGVAVGGAVLGTLLPQIGATALPLLPEQAVALVPGQSDLLNVLAALVLIAGTITSLLYFYFDARPVSEDQVERPGWVRTTARVGQGFLMIAFGSLYAGAMVASLSVLTERINFLLLAPEQILQLLGIG